jgi:phosphopantetheine adenylyltransferase
MFEANAQIARAEYGFELDTVFLPAAREHIDTSSGNVRRLLDGKAYKTARMVLDGRIAEQVIQKYQINS